MNSLQKTFKKFVIQIITNKINTEKKPKIKNMNNYFFRSNFYCNFQLISPHFKKKRKRKFVCDCLRFSVFLCFFFICFSRFFVRSIKHKIKTSCKNRKEALASKK